MTQNAVNTTQRLVQLVTASSVATTKTSTTLPNDNTIPQSGEGGEMLTVTITPTATTSTLLIEFTGFGFSETGVGTAALFQDAGANALAAVYNASTTNNYALSHTMTSGTTSATTFKIRCGSASASFSLNSSDATPTRLFGGVGYAWLSVKEIL